MEIILPFNDHCILKKFKRKLEAHFGVRINLPEFKDTLCSDDTVVATVFGEAKNRSYVLEFLEEEKRKCRPVQGAENSSESNIPVITLSESDSENAVLAETQNTTSESIKQKRRRKMRMKHLQRFDRFNPSRRRNDNGCHATSNFSETESKKLHSLLQSQCATDIPNSSIEERNDRILILSEDTSPQPKDPLFVISKDPIKSTSVATDDSPLLDDSVIILSEDINVPLQCTPSTSCQTTDIRVPTETVGFSENLDDSVIVVSERTPFPPAAEFIPIETSLYEVKKEKRKRWDVSVPIPAPKAIRVLRPIVIDGSNVAREHGKIQNVFSCKGIKLSIEYFLKRGHTKVTALLPHFRKYCRYGPVPTTDQDLLEDLEKSQYVVYTPSRRVNGKMIACYDDRFIVNLASQTEGVILSNDNYRDIIEESPEFKKTIEERLLMFCFVGDIIMIPEDPLGQYGPKLETFLSMKVADEENQSNSSQVINQNFSDQLYGNVNLPSR